MSVSPKMPDECKRLLDNDWMVVMYKSGLGDYAAVAIRPMTFVQFRAINAVHRAIETIPENQITSDFEPSQALTALPEKVFGCVPKSNPNAGENRHGSE